MLQRKEKRGRTERTITWSSNCSIAAVALRRRRRRPSAAPCHHHAEDTRRLQTCKTEKCRNKHIKNAEIYSYINGQQSYLLTCFATSTSTTKEMTQSTTGCKHLFWSSKKMILDALNIAYVNFENSVAQYLKHCCSECNLSNATHNSCTCQRLAGGMRASQWHCFY
jgi:hypothetical protein